MNMVYSSSQRRVRGFTLLEALVALLIVATAIFAVTTKVSLAARIAGQTQQATYGRWVAMNAITELRLKPGLPDTGRSDGDEDMAGDTWSWTMDIANTPVEGLRRVDVEVARTENPDRTVYKMSAFVGNNTTADQVRPWGGYPDGDGPGGRNSPNGGQGNDGARLPSNPLPLPNRPDPRNGFDRGP